MSRGILVRIGGVVALFAPAVAANACTVCRSTTAQAVRAGIFNGSFCSTLLLVTAPFPLFLALLAIVYWRLGRRNFVDEAAVNESTS